MPHSLRLLRQDRALTAISVLLDVAFHAGRGTNGAVAGGADVAERLGAARRGIEPVFQALSRAGLLEGVRGPRGGYRLGRRPRDIRLSEAVVAVAEGTEAGSDLSGALHGSVIAPFWAELDETLREKLENLTLEDLLRRAQEAGLQRPSSEPLNFAI
ncbi:RrF2 family transcriptional regulator [Roseomonas xinghualingensis]|uniref:RrF2 family transcriptional regulator n=1 Tax=Roseomonas xinghualingensis TaxID=2986475 RepID=UPI0021F1C253|nr:Rrf2 family transcriptional regulator [Roseomonas sp. SXEYE001]MCV4206464.1 Rrf2 family transcriptional regulator [Roseomonas sp. SXEYE001]